MTSHSSGSLLPDHDRSNGKSEIILVREVKQRGQRDEGPVRTKRELRGDEESAPWWSTVALTSLRVLRAWSIRVRCAVASLDTPLLEPGYGKEGLPRFLLSFEICGAHRDKSLDLSQWGRGMRMVCDGGGGEGVRVLCACDNGKSEPKRNAKNQRNLDSKKGAPVCATPPYAYAATLLHLGDLKKENRNLRNEAEWARCVCKLACTV